ncbi:MAG: DUF2062 domain-containing protein [Bryobacteraceae bacterium]|jgi:uncharacterized protein (DUF2062 family)
MRAGAGLLRRRIVIPILDLLRQGITPEKIALSIALGITLGVTPVLGSTTILCFLAAVFFRLNLSAIQLVSWVVYPPQLALLIPFIRMGEWIFAPRPAGISLTQILNLIHTDVWSAIATLWTAIMHGLVAWLALGLLASPVIYLVLAAAMRKLSAAVRAEAS